MTTRWAEEADHPWLANFLSPLDGHLRRRQAIFEYTSHPNCLFRIQEIYLIQGFVLSDGTRCEPGDRALDVHLWNEQVPRLRIGSLRWARQINECLEISLRELAHYLSENRSFDDVRAIRANMAFGTRDQSRQLVHISHRFGFEPISPPRPRTWRERTHLFGENILISLMVLARNKAALRGDSLWRARTQVFLSRNILEQRHGKVANRCVSNAIRE